VHGIVLLYTESIVLYHRKPENVKVSNSIIPKNFQIKPMVAKGKKKGYTDRKRKAVGFHDL